MSSQDGKPSVTRKGFLAGAAAMFASAVCPHVARAESFEPDGSNLSEAEEANRLWVEAVRKARAEGAEIVEEVPGVKAAARRGYVTGVATKSCVIKLIPTQVDAIATYTTYSNGNIGEVDNAWIQVSTGSVSNTTYRYTKIDGGRTLCVNYSCQVITTTGLTSACNFYAEFYHSGNGWMSGGPVS